MRSALKQINGQRIVFRGNFSRYGTKSSYRGKPKVTILLLDVKDQSGKTVSDHLWLNRTKGIQSIEPLREGDVIEFKARVKKYTKGYRGYREEIAWEKPIRRDYKLSHPTTFSIVCKNSEKEASPLPVGAD